MLKEIYLSGITNNLDLNCAETVLYIANQGYDLGLDQRTMRLSSGFGGGMYIENTCGALTAGVMVLGFIFVDEMAHESDLIKDIVQEFLHRYEDSMRCTDCATLKEKYRTEEKKCSLIIETALDILENIINNNTDKKVV